MGGCRITLVAAALVANCAGPAVADEDPAAEEKSRALMQVYQKRRDLMEEKAKVDDKLEGLRAEHLKARAAMSVIQTQGKQAEDAIAGINMQAAQATSQLERDNLAAQHAIVSGQLATLTTLANRQATIIKGLDGEVRVGNAQSTRLWNAATQLRSEWLRLTDPFGKWAKGENERTVVILTEWIVLDSECPLAYCARGFASTQLGNNRDAIADFEKALKLDKQFPLAMAGRALAMTRSDQRVKGNNEMRRAITIDRKTPVMNIIQAIIHEESGDHGKAVAFFKKAIDTEDYVARTRAALLLAASPKDEVRDGDEALKLAEKAVELSKRNWMALHALAAAYAETGDFDKAATIEDEAADKAPDAAGPDFDDVMQAYRKKVPLRLPNQNDRSR
jgi:tetratricopeptide (TPR) repeat protein